ncbi:hypothetical protein AURANDRAFT_66369 [Aureococcus anophagefferens]|uniref:Uncharacterized protein n=1 Tax=Aureococcus anophagefferens TaxID=44056 RepID=F0YHA7_AURAN|nr:hypothetical protein AURANDRAFT_66369 [Aureococcus anophagefferens]EGB05411.1 hypothetical protein AURANDRAFT_66369 [Aureococcus anophagefferens]|eukprot:XP_009039795.1 hypothetical protein AURANDRAFT_66369 [Aureococcus anophagefferens]
MAALKGQASASALASEVVAAAVEEVFDEAPPATPRPASPPAASQRSIETLLSPKSPATPSGRALEGQECLQYMLLFERQAAGLDLDALQLGSVRVDVPRGPQVKSALRSAAKLATTALRRCELLEGDVAAEKARVAALRMDQDVLEKRLAMLETRCHQSEKRCSKLDMRADEADRRQEADERWKRTTEERLERAEQRLESADAESKRKSEELADVQRQARTTRQSMARMSVAGGQRATVSAAAATSLAAMREDESDGEDQGRKRERNSQLQRLLSRSFSTREDDDDEPVAELGRAAAAPPAAKPRNRISFAAALAAPPVLAAAAAPKPGGPPAAASAAADAEALESRIREQNYMGAALEQDLERLAKKQGDTAQMAAEVTARVNLAEPRIAKLGEAVQAAAAAAESAGNKAESVARTHATTRRLVGDVKLDAAAAAAPEAAAAAAPEPAGEDAGKSYEQKRKEKRAERAAAKKRKAEEASMTPEERARRAYEASAVTAAAPPAVAAAPAAPAPAAALEALAAPLREAADLALERASEADDKAERVLALALTVEATCDRGLRQSAAAIAAAEAAVEVENANASRQGTIEAELRALRRFQGEFEFKQEKYAERFEAGAAEHRGALATCEGIADGLERRCDDVDAHVRRMADHEARDAGRREREAAHLDKLAAWAAEQVEEVNAAAGRIDALERVATRAATEAADRATRHNLPNVLKPILRDWLEHSGVGPGVRQDELVARLGAMERELDALVGRVADGALEPRRPHPPAGTTAQVCISCNRPTGPHPEASDPFDVLDFLGGGDAPRFVPTLDVKHAAPAKAPARHPPRPQSAPPKRGKLNFVNGKWQTESPAPRGPPSSAEKMDLLLQRQYLSPSPPADKPAIHYKVPGNRPTTPRAIVAAGHQAHHRL